MGRWGEIRSGPFCEEWRNGLFRVGRNPWWRVASLRRRLMGRWVIRVALTGSCGGSVMRELPDLGDLGNRVQFMRRVACVLVAGVVLSMCGRAHAQEFPCSQSYQSTTSNCPTEGAAYVAAVAAYNGWAPTVQGANPTMCAPVYNYNGDGVTKDGLTIKATFLGGACGSGGAWTRSFPGAQSCKAQPKQYGWLADAQHTQACYQGCVYESTLDVSSGEKYYAPGGGVCTSADVPDPKVDTDQDGVPDDEDAFPNDPNESKDSDGDGIGDNADIAPDDPTNGDDKEDGDEKDNQAGGGGDCGAPPSCSGDAIACNTNWQIWRMRCGSGGSVTGDVTNCAAAYTCNADPVQCAQLAVLRVQACKSGSGTGEGDGDGDQPGWTKGAEPSRPSEGDEPAESDVKRFGIGLNPSMLDTEEIFGAGACPALPQFKIFGFDVSSGLEEYWCTIVAIMRALVLLMSGYFALQILMGRVV